MLEQYFLWTYIRNGNEVIEDDETQLIQQQNYKQSMGNGIIYQTT
jgi:hypothetical protein